MYTTSLFHHSLINDVRLKQSGKFLNYAIADANLAAIGSIEEKYLESKIPIRWVGTSSTSIVRDDIMIKQMNDRLPIICGDYTIGSFSLYFFGALNCVLQLYKEQTIRIITSRAVKTCMFGMILNSIRVLNQKEFNK
jgi:hypothetical protein